MKYFITILSIFTFLSIATAQAPQGINFQGVARNADSSPKPAGTTVQIGFKIKDALGADLYTETQSKQTNGVGLFTCVIGQGNPVSGSFSTITWSNGPKLLEVIVDGNSSGQQQIVSVPYALYADKTNLQAGSGISVSGNTINNTGDLSNTNEIQTLSVSGNQLSISGNGGNSVTLPAPPVYVQDIAIFAEKYGANGDPIIAGGGNTNPDDGVWNWRNLNYTVKTSPSVSLNTNSGLSIIKFNATGKYLVMASAPGYRCNRHKIRLVNLNTNAILEGEGTSAFSSGNSGTAEATSLSTIFCVIQVDNVGLEMKLEHWFEQIAPAPLQTLGIPTNIGGTAEKYATIMIQKIE